jgi:hypothetical protein
MAESKSSGMRDKMQLAKIFKVAQNYSFHFFEVGFWNSSSYLLISSIPLVLAKENTCFIAKLRVFFGLESVRQPFESALQTNFACLVHRNGSKICNKSGQAPLVSEVISRDHRDRAKNQSLLETLTEKWRCRAISVQISSCAQRWTL